MTVLWQGEDANGCRLALYHEGSGIASISIHQPNVGLKVAWQAEPDNARGLCDALALLDDATDRQESPLAERVRSLREDVTAQGETLRRLIERTSVISGDLAGVVLILAGQQKLATEAFTDLLSALLGEA